MLILLLWYILSDINSDYRYFTQLSKEYLQHIADNSYRPHISSISNIFKVDNFWCDKLRCTEQDLKFLVRIKLPGQTEINYFYSISGFRQAEYIFGLQQIFLEYIVISKYFSHPFLTK